MSSKSVESLVGKVRALFRDIGRSGEWNTITSSGNPASAPVFNKHTNALTLEQTAHSVMTKQAVPLRFDKLSSLYRHLTYHMSVEKVIVTRYFLHSDIAYFAILCHSGDIAGDLALLTFERLFRMPQDKGILISEVAGKTASSDNSKNSVILSSTEMDTCPVQHLNAYASFIQGQHVTLHHVRS